MQVKSLLAVKVENETMVMGLSNYRPACTVAQRSTMQFAITKQSLGSYSVGRFYSLTGTKVQYYG